MIQLPTGGGKTAIFSAITNSAFGNKKRVWIIAPRTELIAQASEHLERHKVPHGKIISGMTESRAYLVHIVSKQTLTRRWDKIKNWPDLIIIDEAHINYEFQKELAERAPVSCKIIGVTATPERTNGDGLAEKWLESPDGTRKNIGGIWGDIHYGPSIPWLTARGFLSPLRYFAPPIEGLESLKWKAGEVDETELDALLKSRAVYGKCVEYYTKYGTKPDGTMRPALGFCRSVAASKETAQQFRDAGYRAESVDGEMAHGTRKALIDGLRDGKIDLLCCCDLLTYGLDVPRVEYGFSLRPTQSRSLYFQMVGRILRPFDGKSDAVFFDHVNMVQMHQDDDYPGVPLFYLEKIEWNFDGRVKKKRKKGAVTMKLCPWNDYQYCSQQSCHGCPMKPDNLPDPRAAEEKIVDVALEERKAPAKLHEYELAERREIQDGINKNAELALEELKQGRIASGPIGELLRIAKMIDRRPMWVYFTLAESAGFKHAVCHPLLHEIARQLGYKKGWSWMKSEEIKRGIKEGKE